MRLRTHIRVPRAAACGIPGRTREGPRKNPGRTQEEPGKNPPGPKEVAQPAGCTAKSSAPESSIRAHSRLALRRIQHLGTFRADLTETIASPRDTGVSPNRPQTRPLRAGFVERIAGDSLENRPAPALGHRTQAGPRRPRCGRRTPQHPPGISRNCRQNLYPREIRKPTSGVTRESL